MTIENDFEVKVENAVNEIILNANPIDNGTDFRDFLLQSLNTYDFIKDVKYKDFKNELCQYLYDCILFKFIEEERENNPIKEVINIVDN